VKMANLTRYDPFGDLDDMFKGFMLRPVQIEQQVLQIRMDVKENDGAYMIRADIPGVKKDDIKVGIAVAVASIQSLSETRATPSPGGWPR